MRRQAIAVTAMLLLLPGLGLAQKRGMQPTDYYHETTVNDVAMSPDGHFVAFTVTTIVEKENRRHREIWMARLQNGAPEGAPFRFTDPTVDSSGPRWSPDGATLSFTSHRGKDPNTIWFVDVRQPSGEAHHLDGVTAPPVWSPDGKWIAVEKSPPNPDADKPHAGWIAPNAISHTLDPKRFDGRVVTSLTYKRNGTLDFLPDPSIHHKSQIYVVPATGGEAKQLTHTAFSAGDPIWSHDGATIFFTGDEHEADETIGRARQTAIYAIARTGGEPRKLTTTAGSHTRPVVSPDGSRMVFTFTADQGAEPELMVVAIAPDGTFQGTPTNVTGSWDNIPGEPFWTPDGRALRFTAGDHGDTELFEVSVQGRQTREVTTAHKHYGSVSESSDGTVMAYTVSDVMHPTEVFVAKADASGEQRITTFNDAFLAGLNLVPAEPLTWTVKDGTEIQGWVMKPLGYTPGRKYPMILKIHGGPYGAYGTGWFDQFQMLSASGFFVLFTNPRGSTGYGHAYEWATRGKWGEVDREDYLGGVDAALAKYPDIDPKRIGISGGSYGGFMTNWLTATVPDRWAAAVTARSIANWQTWYGTSDAQGLTEYAFYGAPWEQRDLYRRLSPLSHVEQVKTPTLMLVGENDYRTPIGDNETWYMALRKRHVPVEMVLYPRSTHDLSRTGEPWLLVDRLERLRSWFVYWLIDKPGGQSTAGPR
jgi:dipeptidyl aminopeptidase/acylaminoacyl peptidase